MAGRKEYEMMFTLNAALNGNFKGTFSSAQSEFTKLGKEIKDLNRLQSDISAYQKQEQAVASTTAKLANLQQQHDLLQKEIGETTGSTTALEREKVKLEQRIKDTETALERQSQKLNATGQRLEDASINTSDLTGESARLSAQLEDLRQEQENVANSAQRMGQAHQEASEAAEDFGAQVSESFAAAQQALASAGIAAGLHEIYEAYSECVSIAAGFEQSMSTVEALSGSTAAELLQLSAAAKDAGANTSFTALESADAFQYMSLAGWDAQNMLDGLNPILDLAAAAHMDLATASDIVTDYLTAFGLTTQDTGKFVDQMAYAMANSNTNVVQLGEAYKNVAATAKSLKYSVEDTTAVIMTMADAGVKGGEAGTALNAVMTRLATDTKGCAAALAEYGVEVYDARGNMQSLSSILGGMSSIWADLTDQEQANLAKTIAGTNQYSALQTIMTGCSEAAAKTGKSFNDYAAALQNCSGTAGKMAETMLDNLNGQLVLMDSAADALRLTLGEQFTPELRRLAEVGTDVLTWANDFVQEHPALVKGVMTFTGVIGGATVAVTGVNAALMAFKALNAAALFTGPVGAILGVTAAVAGIAGAVVGLTTALDMGVPSVEEMTEAAAEMRETMESAAAAYDDTASSILANANVADTYISKLEDMGDSSRLSAEGQREYQNTLALLLQVMPELSDCISRTTDQYGRTTYTLETTTDALRSNTEAWKQNAMAQAYQDQLASMYQSYADVLLEAEKNSIGLTRAQDDMAMAQQKINDILARQKELENETSTDPERVKQRRAEYKALEAALSDANHEYQVARVSAENYSKAIDEGADAANAAQAEIERTEEAVRSLTGAMDEQSDSTLPELTSALSPVENQLAELASAYEEAYGDAYKSISGQMGLFEQMSVEVDTSIGDMIASLESQVSYMATYSENLRKAAELGLSEGLLAQLSDGSTQSAAYLQAIVDGGETKIGELNAAFAQVEEGKEAFSGTVAEIQIDLAEALTEMEQSVRDGVEAMELSDEAAESARETIQAFIDQADKMLPWVEDAYARIASAAAGALDNSARYNYNNTWAAQFDPSRRTGFASGTDNAPPGWAWVGEEGPELIHMRGGETVLPAEISQEFALLNAYQNEAAAYTNAPGGSTLTIPEIAISPAEQQAAAEAERLTEIYYAAYHSDSAPAYTSLTTAETSAEAAPALEAIPAPMGGGDSSAPIKVEVHIHLEGNASPETVQALEDYVRRGELQEAVADAMENIQADALRGALV